MQPQRWRQIDRVLGHALETSPERRSELLDRECAGDEDLRREVESLLSHDLPDSFLEAGGAAAEAARLVSARTPVGPSGSSPGLSGQRLGRFIVEGRLGEGGMGEVWRARDPLLDRPVALKVVPLALRDDPHLKQRLRREALATSALNHPNIVTLHEILELGDLDVLVTELVEGVTLRDRLAAGPLSLAEAVDIALQIARGLGAAHAVAVVHRDVKPSNVMLRPDGLVKVLDFGIAKSPQQRSQQSTGRIDTGPGAVVGTIAYMSPEQIRGQTVDARTDVWSLGVLLYELATGESPFGGATAADRLAAVLDRDPRPPSARREGLPRELDAILSRALAKDREQRHPDAAALAADLERLQAGLASRAGYAAAEGPQARRSFLRRSRLPLPRRSVWAVAATLTVAAVPASFLLVARSGPLEPIDSIAVLPLVNAGSDPQAEYLSDGISESLIRMIARADGLKVTSRAAAFRYETGQIDAREVGRDLGVRSVLTGSALQRDDELWVSVELIDTRDATHLWGESYQTGMADLATLPQKISRDLLRRLDRPLDARASARGGGLETSDSEAYRLYLQGRYYFYKTSPAEYHRGLDFFLRAIELDPDYALAWAGLGHYYAFAAASGLLEPETYWPRAEHAARRALERDAELPEAAPLLPSVALYWRRDWTGGEQGLRRAVEVFPEALNHISVYLAFTGRLDEALEYRRRDLELVPLSVRSHRDFGITLYVARRYDDAVARLRTAIELDRNDAANWEALATALHQSGRTVEAVGAWRQAMLLSDRAELAELLQATAATAGPEAAIVALARANLEQLQDRRQRGEYVPAYTVARQHLLAGDRARALEWTLRALQERNRLVLHVVRDPLFDPLRDEPSYQVAVLELGLPR